jgi:hypothetical protein
LPHGFDHIAHTVHDLDAAGAFYTRLGFTVGARNRHSWGTHNRIVQLTNSFIELLEVAEPGKIPPHAARSFSFGAFHRDYAAAHQGLSMLLLNSSDAVADARAYEAAGISGYEVFNFGREGQRPDGSVVKLAFSLVFARDPTSPDLSLALCQHHYPENFWSPAFQNHANGATRVAGVVMVADNPSDHHIFLEAYTGLRDLHSSSLGVKAQTEDGEIEIMEPVAFRDQFGIPVTASGEGMTMRAMRFEAADLGRVEAALRDGGVGFRHHVGRLVVPPDEAFGATLIFEPAKVG